MVDAPGQTPAHILYARLAERFLSFLQMPLREGLLYKIDTRLRPSGNQGALVTSDQGFARYHLGPRPDSPQTPQPALGAAGAPAGPARRRRRGALRAHPPRRPRPGALRRPGRPPPALAAEVRRMRERMESEIGKEAARGKNPKVGRGGIVDVEFAVQYLQLAHGHDHPAIRTPSTPVALRRLREAGLLARRRRTRRWPSGYEFHRRLATRMRIVHDYGIDYLPAGGHALAQLARRLGYHGEDPGARLLAEYDRVTEAVRAAFVEVMTA